MPRYVCMQFDKRSKWMKQAAVRLFNFLIGERDAGRARVLEATIR